MKLESLRPLAALNSWRSALCSRSMPRAGEGGQERRADPVVHAAAVGLSAADRAQDPQAARLLRPHLSQPLVQQDFSSYCYGDCGYRARGTISTGGGVILRRPTVVSSYDNDYMVVPRTLYEAPQPVVQRKAPVTPAVVTTNQLRGYKPKPKITMQNGVRVIQLTPLTSKSY